MEKLSVNVTRLTYLAVEYLALVILKKYYWDIVILKKCSAKCFSGFVILKKVLG